MSVRCMPAQYSRVGDWEKLPIILSVKDLVAIYGISEQAIRLRCKKGSIPAHYDEYAKRWEIEKETLKNYIQTKCLDNLQQRI